MNKEIKGLIEQLNVCSVNDYNFEIYGSEAKTLDEYITNLQQENQQLKEENSRLKIKCRKIKKELKEEIKVLELIIGLRQKRNLIHKFDKEYDEEDKRKNPNRDYAGIMPDAEEVYKRYYEQQEIINKAIEYIEKEWCWDGTGIDNLEDILKGGSNE